MVADKCSVCGDWFEDRERKECSVCGDGLHDRCAEYYKTFECRTCAEEAWIGAVEL